MLLARHKLRHGDAELGETKIPQRLAVEYPERCLSLLTWIEPVARENNLVGSFALLSAAPLLTMSWERLKTSHPLKEVRRYPEMLTALAEMERQPFISASFWNGRKPHGWRQSRIISSIETTSGWVDLDGFHPMDPKAANVIEQKATKEVLRVLRNALAHGNIVYLDADGLENVGADVRYLAFVSRYEESEEQRAVAETYRVIVASEDEFLELVKHWAEWLRKLPPISALSS